MSDFYDTRPWDVYPTMTVNEAEKPLSATGILDANGCMIHRQEPAFKFGFQAKPRVRVKAISIRTQG